MSSTGSDFEPIPNVRLDQLAESRQTDLFQGRLSSFANNLEKLELVEEAAKVLETESPFEREVHDK